MFKRLLFLGLLSGILAGVVAIAWQKVYYTNTGMDFAGVVKPVNTIIVSVLATLLASTGYGLLTKWLPRAGEIVFNFVFVIATFASLIGPISMKLPLEYEMPELFLGLAIPMHFFPALGWFTLKPLFIKK